MTPPPTPQTWEQTHWGRSIGIRQAELAMDLQRVAKQAKLVRRLVRKTQNGSLGTETSEPEDDDDDNVHVGDLTIHHPPTTTTHPSSPLITLALASLALLAGTTTGALATKLLSPTPDPIITPDTDTDTQYELILVD